QRALEHGWSPAAIEVIDTDLGRTGSTTAGRPGFKDLVARVTLGQVGIIFAYDVTRLARNCTDWYQLLDLCGYRHCLVGDQDGVYDPATTNGRLILGLNSSFPYSTGSYTSASGCFVSRRFQPRLRTT